MHMLRKCKACYSLNWFKPLMEVSTVHSTRIPHFPQNSEENLSFARKPTEDIIVVIHKIPRSSAEVTLNNSDRLTRADRQALLVLLVRGGTPRPLSLSIFKYTFNLFSVRLHVQYNLFLI